MLSADTQTLLCQEVMDGLSARAHQMLTKSACVRRWFETGDIVQETMVRLWQDVATHQSDNERAFYSFATKRMNWLLSDLARSLMGKEGLHRNHETNHGREMIASSNGDADEQLDWAAFHAAARNLPLPLREVFFLKWYGGLETKEVVAMVGASKSTVAERWLAARLQVAAAVKSD